MKDKNCVRLKLTTLHGSVTVTPKTLFQCKLDLFVLEGWRNLRSKWGSCAIDALGLAENRHMANARLAATLAATREEPALRQIGGVWL